MDDETIHDVRESMTSRAVLAEFGSFALQSDDLDAVLRKACQIVADGMGEGQGARLSKIVELQADGRLYLRATMGFDPEPANRWLEPGRGSSAGHALMSGTATISCDAPNDDRFDRAIVVADAHVRSLVNVLIPDPFATHGPWYGVLEVDSCETRDFTVRETEFLTLYANLIGAAVAGSRARDRMQKLVTEKESLLAELQHRVKNNLAVVGGLIRMQSRQTEDGEARRHLDQIGARLETLRIVHDRLYAQHSTERIEIAAFLTDLVGNLNGFLGGAERGIEATVEADPFRMEADAAIPLGLLVNEFMTNSVRHAFDGQSADRPDWIRVTLTVAGGSACLVLADNGVGMPEAGGRSGGTGRAIMTGLADQLGGALDWGGPPGTSLSVTFPVV